MTHSSIRWILSLNWLSQKRGQVQARSTAPTGGLTEDCYVGRRTDKYHNRMQLLSQLKWVILFVNWKSESRCDQSPARLAIVEHAGVKIVSVQNQAKNYPSAGACRLPTWAWQTQAIKWHNPRPRNTTLPNKRLKTVSRVSGSVCARSLTCTTRRLS